jgi:uncharacterized membrane protein YjfL (UPF0719 family)
MDVQLMLTAVARKAIFAVMLLVFYLFFDRVIMRGFDTSEVLKDDPKAIATLLAGFAVAVALA